MREVNTGISHLIKRVPQSHMHSEVEQRKVNGGLEIDMSVVKSQSSDNSVDDMDDICL